MLTLANEWLELGVNEADGSIETLRLSSSTAPGPIEYVEPRTFPEAPSVADWGDWEVRDSFTTFKPADAQPSVVCDEGSIVARWETGAFVLTIVRELQPTRLVETVSLEARVTMTVIDMSVAFRPAVTDFLDASEVSVGEHASFIETDERRSAYHWFAGGDYAHLMFTQVTGRGPHLGIVLSEGRIHAVSTPYLHGGPTLTNDYQAYSTHLMYPRLHVTGFATHKQQDEYPQPILDLRPGDVETFTLSYFPFDDLDDFRRGVLELARQPTFDYPRFWPAGQASALIVQLPSSHGAATAEIGGAPLPLDVLSEGRFRFAIPPQQSGLHRIDVGYGTKRTFILFEAVHDVQELLDRRVDYILSAQQCRDPEDPRYGGIFMTDMPTGRWLTRDDLYTVQAGGSGEMVATGQLVVYRNLIDPDPLQIRQAEIYANEWLRLRCQDEDFSTPLNPLNRMAHKDRGWTYEPGLERIFNNPDFPAEKAWRVHNANWIAPFYFLLSEISDGCLTMRSSATYLDWAYQTMRWQFGTEPGMSADQSYFVPRVVQKLRSTGRAEAASDLEGHWQAFVARIASAAQRLAASDFNFDDSMFYCSAIPLLIESRVDEARSFLESHPYNVGLSYDPRVQTAFRYWDDYLTDLPFEMMPYLTRPHFWSITDCYPLLQLYEATHDEAALDSAYQGIMAFYEHYNFGYRWNTWGEMRLGQGHPCFLPSHDLHSQEQVCADQDPAFVTYLETFGRRCYVTASGRTVNAALHGRRLESWAPFPAEYHLDDRGQLLTSGPRSVVMPWIETTSDSIQVLVRNLSREATDARVALSGPGARSVSVLIGPYAERIVELECRA